ncbi:MAG: DUF2975 domain-containing protein, partial [Flavitalea sp.]
KQILRVLLIIAWIIFVGLGIEAGGYTWNTIYPLVTTPYESWEFWNHTDLSSLYNADKGQFAVIGFFISLTFILKAILFYLIIRLLQEDNLNMLRPFTRATVNFLLNVSYLSIAISFFSGWGVRWTESLVARGFTLPTIDKLNLDGSDVWSFMGVTMFVIAQVFKRGIEIQTENELTI